MVPWWSIPVALLIGNAIGVFFFALISANGR